jgi:hypothetical protein
MVGVACKRMSIMETVRIVENQRMKVGVAVGAN